MRQVRKTKRSFERASCVRVASLTETGGPVRCDLVSLGAGALEAALRVETFTSTTQQRVPLALVNV